MLRKKSESAREHAKIMASQLFLLVVRSLVLGRNFRVRPPSPRPIIHLGFHRSFLGRVFRLHAHRQPSKNAQHTDPLPPSYAVSENHNRNQDAVYGGKRYQQRGGGGGGEGWRWCWAVYPCRRITFLSTTYRSSVPGMYVQTHKKCQVCNMIAMEIVLVTMTMKRDRTAVAYCCTWPTAVLALFFLLCGVRVIE